MKLDLSFLFEHSTPKSLESILEDIYSAIDLADSIPIFPSPRTKSIVGIKTSSLDKIMTRLVFIPKRTLSSKELEMREIESNKIVRYLKSIAYIIDQLNLSNPEKYRIAHHLVTGEGSDFIVNLLARIEGIKFFVECGSIKTESLIRLSGCICEWDKISNRLLTGCHTISTYDQDTKIVTVHCESQRKKGRYKQIVGKANKVLKFKRIELIL